MTSKILSDNILQTHDTMSNIRESPSQFENRIMPRVFIRSIKRSTMYQKLHFVSQKISSVGCGFSSIKIDYSVRRMKFMYFSIKYRYSDILLKNINFIYNRLFCCDHTCYCVNMVSVTSASRYITSTSRYHTRYQSRSSMYICGLIPRNFAELAEAVPIARGRVTEQ